MSKVLIKLHPERCFPPLPKGVKFDGILLRPGLNPSLSEAETNLLLGNKDFTTFVDVGAIELIQPETVASEINPNANNELVNLGGYGIDQTDDIIAATSDLDLLGKWLEQEKRVTVRRQLNQRIEIIKGGRE
jgi:hypothetical protein